MSERSVHGLGNERGNPLLSLFSGMDLTSTISIVDNLTIGESEQPGESGARDRCEVVRREKSSNDVTQFHSQPNGLLTGPTL